MWTAPQLSDTLPKPELYATLAAQLRSLIADEPDAIANMANCAALLYHSLPDVNWAGFYLLKGTISCSGRFRGSPRAFGFRSGAAFAARRPNGG